MSYLVLRSRLLVVCVLGLLSMSACLSSVTFSERPSQRASILQDWDDPVAVIGVLPDTEYVGSDILLDGSDSHDDSGTIENYTWEISHWDEVEYLYGEQTAYTLSVPGLNTIKLTVTDPDDKTGVNFTAVMCIRLDGTSYPVAIIMPLPPIVSNGTWQSLDASMSHDETGGVLHLVSYTWEITNLNANLTEDLYGSESMFKFRALGTYTIKLTVADFDGNIGIDFTAVVAVLDSDGDELPDWWEEIYWHDLEFGKMDDPDGDGYTDIQEYAAGTNPIVADPPPKGFLENYWMYVAAAAGAIVVAVLAMLPAMKRKRKAAEKKKIEYAIEIEKALDEEK
jgi:hypothetical protein